MKFRLVFLITTKKLRLHLYIITEICRIIQICFIKIEIAYLWFGTSENLFHQATHYATKTKNPFDVSIFFLLFLEVQL